MTTTNVLGAVTDSAAAATAMATGTKVRNLTISQLRDGTELPTSLEFWQARGRSTGLVTTSFIEDASPAAFAAHATSRLLLSDIASDLLTQSRPNLLLGGVVNASTTEGIDPVDAAAAGYSVVFDRASLFALDPATHPYVSGQFFDGEMPFEWDYAQGATDAYDMAPFLSEMAAYALAHLSQDPDGFFLFLEHEGPDLAGHLADPTLDEKIQRSVFSTLQLSRTVQMVLDWIAAQPDPSETLLIVTADHETGGLDVLQDNGVGSFPTVSWEGDAHTSDLVRVYAWGPNAQLVSGTIDNTFLYTVMTTVPEPGVALLLAAGALVAARSRRRREGPPLTRA
jgi:alkaline phosphatase